MLKFFVIILPKTFNIFPYFVFKIMSGSSVVKDGSTLVNSYGPELDTLREGDCLGVIRTSKVSKKLNKF